MQKLVWDDCLFLSSGNGRERQIFLTERGKKLMRKKILPVAEAEEKAFYAMKLEDRQTMLSLMEQCLGAFQETMGQYFASQKED